jgi:hypothetical protein
MRLGRRGDHHRSNSGIVQHGIRRGVNGRTLAKFSRGLATGFGGFNDCGKAADALNRAHDIATPAPASEYGNVSGLCHVLLHKVDPS